MKIINTQILTEFFISSLLLMALIFIQKTFQFNTVITLSFITLISTFILKDERTKKILYTIIFCAMGQFLHDDFFMIHSFILVMICLLCFYFLDKFFYGHGGKLGTIAFISSLLYFGIKTYVY